MFWGYVGTHKGIKFCQKMGRFWLERCMRCKAMGHKHLLNAAYQAAVPPSLFIRIRLRHFKEASAIYLWGSE